MQNLDPDKTHVYDEISISMMQICTKSVCKSLQLIFNQCKWKKNSSVPVFIKKTMFLQYHLIHTQVLLKI